MKRFIDEKFQSKNYVPSTSEEVEYIVERTKEMMENNLRLINWARNLYSSMGKASILEKREIEKNSGLSPEEIMKNLVENYEPPTYGFPVSVIGLNVEELKEIMRNLESLDENDALNHAYLRSSILFSIFQREVTGDQYSEKYGELLKYL